MITNKDGRTLHAEVLDLLVLKRDQGSLLGTTTDCEVPEIETAVLAPTVASLTRFWSHILL
jgi:hypothetical protein